MIICEDRVITSYTSSGTNLGDFENSTATSKKLKVNEMSIYSIRNSKVCEQWCLADDLHMSRQLSLL